MMDSFCTNINYFDMQKEYDTLTIFTSMKSKYDSCIKKFGSILESKNIEPPKFDVSENYFDTKYF